MLTEVTLHKELHGFSIWSWSAGQLNVFLLSLLAAALILSNLCFLQYNCNISSCNFSQVMIL